MTSRALLPALTFVFLGLLAACDSPSPRFANGTQKTVTVDGSTFSVHRLGDEVEVYRTSFEARPVWGATIAKAEKAIQIATGCPVKEGTLYGDPALVKAELDCG